MQIQTAPQFNKFAAAAFGLGASRASRIPAGTHMVLAKDEELFAEGDEAEFFYQVVSGAIRSYKLLSDGRRQIDAFHLRGDIFGLEAGGEHRFSAEAVGDVQVIAYRRSRLSALIEEDTAFRERIMNATLRSLERAQEHMLLLGRKTAQERLATFLLLLAHKAKARGIAEGAIDLPMNRSEIADYLGLSLETVSRQFTKLKSSGHIRIEHNNEITIRDLDGLTEIAEGTVQASPRRATVGDQ